eukprot:Transcript_13860.p2 GENE.Transcript_13860~~Transcript_13860.p2  ORF type:complete len:371 (-),score=90.90 Transcript_13860:593-1705(-)
MSEEVAKIEAPSAASLASEVPADAASPTSAGGEGTTEQQRKVKRKRKSKEVESRLSFSDELEDSEESSSSPRVSLGALTAERFEAEAAASQRKRRSSSSQQMLRAAALSSEETAPRAPASSSSAASLRPVDDAWAPGAATAAADHPVLVHAAAQSRGGRPYMEDRHVWVQDLGTLASRLQGLSYACVLDGHGGSRAADFCAAELHKRLAADAALRVGGDAAAVAGCFKRVFASTDRDFLTCAASEAWGDGTTVCAALLHGSTLHLANVGDTRAVMGRAAAAGADSGGAAHDGARVADVGEVERGAVEQRRTHGGAVPPRLARGAGKKVAVRRGEDALEAARHGRRVAAHPQRRVRGEPLVQLRRAKVGRP